MKKSVYDASGTHAAIAMRPDDDMKLAKILKQRGKASSEMLMATDIIKVEWANSVHQVIAYVRGNVGNTIVKWKS